MKRLFTVLSLAVALLVVSCSEDPTTDDVLLGGNGSNTENPEEGPMKYITIGFDDVTRIAVGEEENGKVPLYWNEGDKLMVNKTGASSEIAAEYSGKKTAVIGVTEATTYPMTLVYPYAASTKSAKWFILDAEQTYDPAKLANGWGVLMATVENEGEIATMQHMCGYMKVSLTGTTTVKRVMLRTIGHEPLSGYFKYPTTSATDGKIGMVRFNGADALADGYYDSPIIAINCGDGVALSGEATDFYFALPAATYSKGFALTVIDTTGKQHCVTAYTSGKEVEAGALIEMPTLAVNCTEEQGIYNGNELAGYVRTLEKDVWLDVTDGATLHIRGEADLSDEDLSDVDDVNESSELFYWRIDATDRYNCGSITTIDGHDNAITGYNREISATAAGLLFHEIPATMTVRNLSLGKTADDPSTEANEADCTLTATGSGTTTSAISSFGAFCYNLLGTIDNCNNYAKVNVKGTSAGALRVGGIHCGASSSVGTVSNSTNYGYIYCNAASATASYIIVGGIAASDAGEINNCVNVGPVTVEHSAYATYVGGIVGYADKERGLTGLSNSGAITLTYPKAGSRIGGIVGYTKTLVTSCTNTGSIRADLNAAEGQTSACHIGGVVGSSAYKNQTLEGCVNGEEGTTKGSVTSNTGQGRGNVYLGGVMGLSNEDYIITLNNVTNYGPVTCEAVKTFYIGGVVGDSNAASSTYTKCYNYGAINIANGNSTSWSYAGGVLGRIASGTTTKNITNEGDITINSSGSKARVGGLCGYFSATTTGVANCDITVEAIGASSNIGGLGGYAPGKTISGCSYKGTLTCKDAADATVMVGGLYGIANGATVASSRLNATIVNTSAATCGLITTAPLSAKTLNLGTTDKRFLILPTTVFCGVNVTGADKVSVNPEEGKANLVNDVNSDYKFTVNQTNVQYTE